MILNGLFNEISKGVKIVGAVRFGYGKSFYGGMSETKLYANAVNFVGEKVKKISAVEEKIAFLKLIRQSVIDEIACEYKNRILYKGFFNENEHRTNLCYLNYDENSNSLFEPYKVDYTCDLSKNNIISFPWHIDRLMNTFHYISRDNFKYDPLNHYVYYFPQLNLYVAHNGLHSISAGVTSKQGLLPCSESYDISKMFDSVYTDDGIHWLNKNDPDYKGVIGDFRFAIIYTISKLLWDISPLYLKYSYYFVMV